MKNPAPTQESGNHHTDHGLLNAFILDGKGGGKPVDWEYIQQWTPERGPLWTHLDLKSKKVRSWIRKESGLTPVICNALLAEETRPRAQEFNDGMLVILRGVNLNPGAQPDDMISVRIWVEANRIITLRSPKLLAVSDVRDSLEGGSGPKTTPGVLVQIVERLSFRMAPVINNLEDLIDSVEETMLTNPDNSLRSNLVDIRRQAIALRRYIGPQRDAISNLNNSRLPLLESRHRTSLHEAGDQATRYVEDLDSIRERTSIVHEELSARMSEQMNRTMFLLSIVAGIFLPLGLITGLLGINVGGMPGVDNPYAFTIVCVILVALGALGVWLFRHFRLF